MNYFKSTAVARMLDVPYYRLFALIRDGKLAPPPKDSSGDYVWTERDIEGARRALLTRGGRREALALDQGGDGQEGAEQ
jgi:hypothetical protein